MGNTHGIGQFLNEDDPNPPNPLLQPVFQVGSLEETRMLSWYKRPVQISPGLQEVCPNFPQDINELSQARIYVIRAARDLGGNKLPGQFRSYPIRITSVHNPYFWDACTVNVAYTDGSGYTMDSVNITRIFWLPAEEPVPAEVPAPADTNPVPIYALCG